MKHPDNCFCVECFNRGARLGDAARKAKLVDPIGKPQACDEESMTMWFDYYEDTVCKA